MTKDDAKSDSPGEQGESKDSPSVAAIRPYMWPKGVSGNPAGRKQGSVGLTSLIRARLHAGDSAEAKLLVDRLFQVALEGADNNALKALAEVMDRVEGKPAQRVEHVVEASITKLVELQEDPDE